MQQNKSSLKTPQTKPHQPAYANVRNGSKADSALAAGLGRKLPLEKAASVGAFTWQTRPNALALSGRSSNFCSLLCTRSLLGADTGARQQSGDLRTGWSLFSWPNSICLIK